MSTETLARWEAEAATEAENLCARFADMSADGLQLDQISPDEANGSNSLDEAFFARLEQGDHLTDRFLSDK
ncbi:hypothetical protein [Sphingopyxis sp. MSC1_008]|jgi:hypothetical protein|uniref:hypothetical protein n=1 Tax=Sphingopyxis sp. MSC1_008 TaxID=2909265 RepID=UPI0020C07774|nr:hypothetical protein [Sphingopyxis sp. MSC1_008]